MVENTEILGEYERVIITSPTSTTLSKKIPFVIEGYSTDNTMNSRMFSITINDILVHSIFVNDYHFTAEFEIVNVYDDYIEIYIKDEDWIEIVPNMDSLSINVSVVVPDINTPFVSDTKGYSIVDPSLAEATYYLYSLLKNILENDYGIIVEDNEGPLSLIEKVEAL